MARLPKACPQCGCLGECHSRWILFYEFEPLIYIAVITLLIFGPVFAFMAGYSAGKDSVRCEAVKLGAGNWGSDERGAAVFCWSKCEK